MPVERLGPDMHIHPAGPLFGAVDLPGSKSLANRYLVCAALAGGTSTLRRVSDADDVRLMIDALRTLGVRIETTAPQTLRITGCDGHLPECEASLNAGAAGTVMRFLAALVAAGHGTYTLDGSERMRQRPIGELAEALRQLGAGVEFLDRDGYPPLRVHASGLRGGEAAFAAPPSSQFVSALLMVAPLAADDVMIALDGPLPSRPYVSMTLAIMRRMGVEALDGRDLLDDSAASAAPRTSAPGERPTDAPDAGRGTRDAGERWIVPAPQRYQPGDFTVEPDASAATYFWGAAAITGGRVMVRGLTRASLQGDTRFVDVLERMGCTVGGGDEGLQVTGPPPGTLRGITVDLNDMPDTVQTLAVLAAFAVGPTRIENVANLRLKETDRIAALHRELSKLGAKVEAHGDGLTVHPCSTAATAGTASHAAPIALDTYDDHRMAMSLSLAGLVRAGIVIRNAACVSKSFPDYFTAFAGLRPNA